MIFEVFQILTEQVNQYFQQVGMDDSEVIMDNIALSDGSSDESEAMRDKVVLNISLDKKFPLLNCIG
ncbi:MAG: hypothetical protein WD431_08940 [Cyclobacteriaceae bacterium]